MDKELMELIDTIMEPLERFRLARKHVVAVALAEAANELLNDGYDDVVAHSIIRDLKHKDALRRSQESLMMRKVADDLLSRLASEGDPTFSAIVDPVTKPGSVADLTRNYYEYGTECRDVHLDFSQARDHSSDKFASLSRFL